jgi:hypothetical protein
MNFNPDRNGPAFNSKNLLESLHFEVAFKAIGSRKYQIFHPEDILGFEFKYNSVDYVFRSFVLEPTSLVTEERILPRFLNLVYRKGPVSVYRNRTRARIFNSDPLLPSSIVQSDYYLLNDQNVLTKIESKEELNNLLNQRR